MKNDGDYTQHDHPATRSELKAEARRSETRGWIICISAAVTIALLLRLFVFEFVSISQTSMEPTLNASNYVFMERVSYWFSQPAYGDVVICEFPGSSATYVKRVIGVAGDTLEIRDGVLMVNGQADTGYFSGYMNDTLTKTVVPEGCVYVMGDNRNVSVDSRWFGPVKLSMVHGRALFVVWPLGQIHGL